MEEMNRMDRTTKIVLALIIILVVVMAFCQLIADQTRDPDVAIYSEYSEPFPPHKRFPELINANESNIYWLGYNMEVLNINDTFSIIINSYYAQSVSILWPGQSRTIKKVHVGFASKAMSYEYVYKAINATSFTCLIRLELSDTQVFLRNGLGTNIPTNILLTPLFVTVFGLILISEKTSTKRPLYTVNKELSLRDFLTRLIQKEELDQAKTEKAIHTELLEEVEKREKRKGLSKKKRLLGWMSWFFFWFFLTIAVLPIILRGMTDVL